MENYLNMLQLKVYENHDKREDESLLGYSAI
jgi:hypothetical protein